MNNKNISTKLMTQEQWLAERNNSIGMSDAGAVLGHNPWKSNVDLYLEKIGQAPPTEDNLAMRLGRDMEPVVKKLFEEETGLKVYNDNKIRIDNRYSFLTTNLDGFVTGERVPVEYKTMVRWDGEIPDNYFCQIQGQMMITGADYIYYAALVLGSPKQFIVEKYDRNDDFISSMRKDMIEFWKENVTKGIPPEPRTVEDAKKILNQVDPGKIREAGQDIINNINELVSIRHEKSILDKKYKDIQLGIMKYMDDSELLQSNGLDLVSWRQSKEVKRFNSKKFKGENPDLYNKYQEDTAGSRRFLIKIKQGEE